MDIERLSEHYAGMKTYQNTSDRRNRPNRRYSDTNPWYPFYDRHGNLVSTERRKARGRRGVDKHPWWKSSATLSAVIVGTLLTILVWGIVYLWQNQDSVIFDVVADSLSSNYSRK